MHKRHQVFVSSTFKDLEEERKEVMKALLELRCIPAGMEMFPAANDEQWNLIQRVIDESDYYIVIVGGRYGSIDAQGMSYTEKEYHYAVKKGIPVYGFVHGDPGKIPGDKLESDTKARKRLDAFRKLVETKHVKYWKSPSELGGVVSRAISIAKEDEPRTGWVRGDQGLSDAQVKRFFEMEAELEELRRQTQTATSVTELYERLTPLAKKLLHESVSHPADRIEFVTVDGLLEMFGKGGKMGRFKFEDPSEKAVFRQAVKLLEDLEFWELITKHSYFNSYAPSQSAFEVIRQLEPVKD